MACTAAATRRCATSTGASARWNGTQAYCDSKLLVTALAQTLARAWPAMLVRAVDPGWVPTRMGGPGGYWHHRRREAPATAAEDPAFQAALLEELERLTNVPLPGG